LSLVTSHLSLLFGLALTLQSGRRYHPSRFLN
jgi:hypothetical protein